MSITVELIDLFQNNHLMRADEGERPALTAAEIDAANRYNETIAGIEDTLDIVDADTFRSYATEHGHDEATKYAQHLFSILGIWWTAIDTLHSDLSNGGLPHNTSLRLIEWETTTYFRHVNVLRREACRWLLGDAAPSPVGDGTAHLSNYPFIEIGREALA